MPIPPISGGDPSLRDKLNRVIAEVNALSNVVGSGASTINRGPGGIVIGVSGDQISPLIPRRADRSATVQITALASGAGMYLGTLYDGVSTASQDTDAAMPAGLTATIDCTVINASESGGAGHALAVGAWVQGTLMGGWDGTNSIVVIGAGGSNCCGRGVNGFCNSFTVTLTPSGDTQQATLAWSFPARWSNPLSVDVDYSTDSGATWTTLLSNYTGGSPYLHTPLTGATNYWYRIKPHCATCFCDYVPLYSPGTQTCMPCGNLCLSSNSTLSMSATINTLAPSGVSVTANTTAFTTLQVQTAVADAWNAGVAGLTPVVSAPISVGASGYVHTADWSSEGAPPPYAVRSCADNITGDWRPDLPANQWALLLSSTGGQASIAGSGSDYAYVQNVVYAPGNICGTTGAATVAYHLSWALASGAITATIPVLPAATLTAALVNPGCCVDLSGNCIQGPSTGCTGLCDDNPLP